jgi:photosystem II stability/assembly factor-like uncharacterized protein
MNKNIKLKINKNPQHGFSFLAMPLAICIIVLFLLQQSAAQSPLNVWQSNGPNANICTVAVDPFNPSIVYAGASNGVFKSVNYGANWFQLNLGGATDFSFDYANPNTIYAAHGGVFKSTDGGANWSSLNSPDVSKIQVSRSNPNFIVASDSLYASRFSFVSVSTNGGATWQTRPFPPPFPGAVPWAFEIDPQNPNNIFTFVGSYDDIAQFKSNNGGATWEPFSYQPGYIIFTSALKVSPDNSNIVYAATYFGIYKSTDGGANWTLRGQLREPETLAIDPLNPNILYAGRVVNPGCCYDGVHRSTNDGTMWSAFNNGLTNPEVKDLAFDRAGRFLHAATPTGVFSVRLREVPNGKPIADFDGDGRSDISVFRPTDRTWYLNQSTAGFSATQFGLSTDKITPADFDGDGKTDIAVYRDGIWFWLNSSNGNFNAFQFGLAGDIPQPADFTGDGRAELAVYRAGTWFTWNLANNQFNAVQFGVATDKPVVGDYDGDGRADFAVYRDGLWYLLQSTQGFTAIQFSIATDKLVPADYDGDGKTDIAVYRDGIWHLLKSSQGYTAFQFGISTDIPAPADYDGDGKADAAVYREGIWYLLQSSSGFSSVQFGLMRDKPVPTAYLP